MSNVPAAETDIKQRLIAGEAEQRFVSSFFAMYKIARLVDANNATFIKHLTTVWDRFTKLLADHDDLTLKVLEGRLFVDDQLVKFTADEASIFRTILDDWSQLGIGGCTLRNDVERTALSDFFVFVAQLRIDNDNREQIATQISEMKFPGIDWLSVEEVSSGVDEAPERIRQRYRKIARRCFGQALTTVQEVVVAATEDKQINAAKTRRVVHSLIDHVVRDESSLLELTAIRDFDDYTFAHSTNVCIYSLVIGVRLGFDRARLSQLGFSALFHDIGKVKLPKDLITKPDAFDEDDWVQMQRHPLLGAKTILKNLPLDIHSARAARGAFEHHINADFTGYPMLRHERRIPTLFSKIISIADTFDALSSGRVYLKKQIMPDKVLKKMRGQMRVKFDPFLLNLFTDVVGIYPPGTLVLLTTEELALVLANTTTDTARPYVKIVGNQSGLFEAPIWADLSTEAFSDRGIVRQVDPTRYGLSAEDFILAEDDV